MDHAQLLERIISAVAAQVDQDQGAYQSATLVMTRLEGPHMPLTVFGVDGQEIRGAHLQDPRSIFDLSDLVWDLWRTSKAGGRATSPA